MSDVLVINGQTYDLGLEADRAKLATDVADSKQLVIEGATVFRSGWNRNGIAPHPKQLKAYAKTAKGTPVLFGHDDGQLLGASDSMEYTDDGKLVQSMRFDAPEDGSPGLVQRMLALKIMPRFSIGWMPGEGSIWECSECHKDMRDYTKPWEEQCRHYPGMRLSTGGTVQAWITNSTHAETSVTFTPAVPGTGLESRDDYAELVADVRAHKATALEAHETETAKREAEAARAALEAEQTKLATLQAERDRLQAEDDARVVTDLRRAKGLTGTHEEWLADYRADRALVRRVLSRLPDSQLSKTLSPAPVQYRDDDLTPKTAAQQLAAEVDSICSADPKRDRAQVWRECRAKYNL